MMVNRPPSVTTTFLAVIIFEWFATIRASQCLNTDGIFHHRLVDNVIRNTITTDIAECMMLCHAEYNCVSINHKVSDGTCELNRAKKTARPASFKPDMEYVYMDNPLPRNGACSSSPCVNGGTCSTNSQQDNYTCSCPLGFEGSNCEHTPTWPKGTYGIPQPTTGCPASRQNFTWQFGSRKHDAEDSGARSAWSDPIHLTGTRQKSTIILNFCMKTSAYGTRDWPKGSYCVYKKGGCPQGFSEGAVKWDDEDSNNGNEKSGVLPDGTYNSDTVVKFCCRSDSPSSTTISLPTDKPFYLFRYPNSTAPCQNVNDMRVSEEWLFWDCEDSSNSSKMQGTFPALVKTSGDIKLFYCFYFK